jgi:hypothetical protein
LITKTPYIALVLLAVFSATLLPFNLLHHHAEDEHAAVMISNESFPAHHCELDNHFCQPNIQSHCGHKAHLQQRMAKCFSCDFHFIKHFEGTQPFLLCKPLLLTSLFSTHVASALLDAIVLVSNKGPPCQA